MGQEQKGLWGWRAHRTVFRWQRFEPVCTCEVGPTSANKDTCLLFQGLGHSLEEKVPALQELIV